MQLSPAFVTEPCGSEVFSVRFSPDDGFLAAGSAKGLVNVYNVSTGQEAYRLNLGGAHPMKQVCWRPEPEGASVRTRGVLVGASTDGHLRQWHVKSGRCLGEFGDPEAIGQLFCVDYSSDGAHVVTGGLQPALWVFDEETKRETCQLTGGDCLSTHGHASRIFAVRFGVGREDLSTVVSGGWDNSVQFWDLRAGHAVRAIYGPHICGDALDISADGRMILTGSWREREQLELWDFGTGRRLDALSWRSGRGLDEPSCLLYTARFSRQVGERDGLIVAGGSVPGPGGGEAKILERHPASGWEGRRCAGTLVRFTCLSADFSNDAAALVALGGKDGRLRVLHVGASPLGAQSRSMDAMD